MNQKDGLNLSGVESRKAPGPNTIDALADRLKFFVHKGINPYLAHPDAELTMLRHSLQLAFSRLIIKAEGNRSEMFSEINEEDINNLESLIKNAAPQLAKKGNLKDPNLISDCTDLIARIKQLNADYLLDKILSSEIHDEHSYALFYERVKGIAGMSLGNLPGIIALRADLIQLIDTYKNKSYIGEAIQEHRLASIIDNFERFLRFVAYYQFYFSAIHLMKGKVIDIVQTLSRLALSLTEITKEQELLKGIMYNFLIEFEKWIDQYAIDNMHNETGSLLQELQIPDLIRTCSERHPKAREHLSENTPTLGGGDYYDRNVF